MGWLSQRSFQIIRVAFSECNQALVRCHIERAKKRSTGAIKCSQLLETVLAANGMANYLQQLGGFWLKVILWILQSFLKFRLPTSSMHLVSYTPFRHLNYLGLI